MRRIMAESMEDGAVGVAYALIYPPDAYVETAEIVEVCKVVAQYNGVYISHVRSEAARLHEGIAEAIEQARKTVAQLVNAAPSEITFTSGGTEADNYALFGSVRTLGLRHAITSPLEHHAVLHPLQALAKTGETELSYLRHDTQGNLDLSHLEELLASHPRSFVSLMHGNNKLGNLNGL